MMFIFIRGVMEKKIEQVLWKSVPLLLVETDMLIRASKYETTFMLKKPSHLYKILSMLYILMQGGN